MIPPGPDLDTSRRLVVERNLAPAAFACLTSDAFMALPFEALGPTKALLKRFFSPEPWSEADDEALAAAVGDGEGGWRRDLDADLALEYGWDHGRFGVRVAAAVPAASRAAARAAHQSGGDGARAVLRSGGHEAPLGETDPLGGTFDGPVVPEATPNPRTIRFHVGPIHDDRSRWYESAPSAEDDPGAARLFSEFAEVANVLVGPDFVAVGLHRPVDWERLLRPVLSVVTEEFASPTPVGGQGDNQAPRVMGGPAGAGAPSDTNREVGRRRLSRLQQAWRDLGSVRPGEAAGLDLVRAAAASDDPSYRQVAASLLREADARAATEEWARLVSDPVRSVRRAAVDAMVDADRAELRPLLETVLGDSDPWIRWKALRGLAQLGAEPSRAAVAPLADDPDFRVRLEVAAALRSGP